MGKDKVKAAPAAGGGAGAAAAGKAGEEKKAGEGRGHRQRGAGTVITAKPAMVTNDGIVLKAHERLPSQILHEYCQREKRPIPQYFSEPPGRRFKVVLRDAKNSRNDLSYCPVQSFESETLAKNYAALLALFQLQRAFPLERKLPEPFATTWLQMIRGGGSDSSGADAAASISGAVAESKTAAAPADRAESKEGKQKNKGPVSTTPPPPPVSTNEAPQWLCDNCATPNFVTNANGTPRAKCFRCQSPKPEIVSWTSAPSNRPTATNASNASNSGGNNASTVPKVEKGKPTPQAVLDLQARAQHASRAEKDAGIAAMKQRQNAHHSYHEAVRQSNPLNQLRLPQGLRAMLERLLGLEVDEEVDDNVRVTKSGTDNSSKTSLAHDDNNTNTQKEAIRDLSAKDHELFASLLSRVPESSAAIFSQLYSSGWNASLLSTLVDTLLPVGLLSESTWPGPFNTPHNIYWVWHTLLLLLDFNNDNVSDSEGTNLRAHLARLYTRTFPPTESVKDAIVFDADQESERATNIAEEIDVLNSIFDNNTRVFSSTLDPENTSAAVVYTFDVSDMPCFAMLRSEVLTSLPSTEKGSLSDACIQLRICIPSHTAYPTESPLLSLSSTWTEEDTDSIQRAHKHVFLTALRVVESHLYTYLQTLVGTPVAYEVYTYLQHWSLPTELTARVVTQLVDSSNNGHSSNSLRKVKQQVVRILQTYDAERCQPLWEGTDETESEEAVEDIEDILGDAPEVIETVEDNVDDDIEESLTTTENDSKEADTEVITSSLATTSMSSATDAAAPISKAPAKQRASQSNANSNANSNRTGKATFWDRRSHFAGAQGGAGSSGSSAEMLRMRQTLPAWQQREYFLSLFQEGGRSNGEGSCEAVIVTGETGCGKTTQMPQYILESQPNAKILVCQPRRLAATGVALRVAEEQGYDLNNQVHARRSTVGYMVKGDVQVSAQHTRLVFATYGVLLRRLQDDPLLTGIDYVVLDEVHERGMDSDFCLALLCACLLKRRNQSKSNGNQVSTNSSQVRLPPLRLVLMSATISTEAFQQYLYRQLYPATTSGPGSAVPSVGSLAEAARRLVPVLEIPGRTFPVVQFYKNSFESFVKGLTLRRATTADEENTADDLDEKDEDAPKYTEIGGKPSGKFSNASVHVAPQRDVTLNNQYQTRDVDYDLLVRLVLTLVLGRKPTTGELAADEKLNALPVEMREELYKPVIDGDCILVFLPGVPEIQKVVNYLRTYSATALQGAPTKTRLEILPLHGNLSPAEQKRVFQHYTGRGREKVVKIVCATNVAEASITIPDVTVVIDTCRVKIMTFETADDNSNNATNAEKSGTTTTSKESSTSSISEAIAAGSGAWSLTMQFAAQDSLRQRAGRAGRVQQGRCYRLITEKTYQTKLLPQSIPEMLRLPLDNVLLQTMAMITLIQRHNRAKNGDTVSDQPLPSFTAAVRLLQRCPSPPSAGAIETARIALQQLQALTDVTSNHADNTGVNKLGRKHHTDRDYALTPLGEYLAKLPVLPRVGKLLIYGCLLQCTLPALAIAAALTSASSKSIFITPGGGEGSTKEGRDRVFSAIQDVKERILREVPAPSTELINFGTDAASTMSNKPPASDHYITAQLVVRFLSLDSTANKRRFCTNHCLVYERMQEIGDSLRDLAEDLWDLQLFTFPASQGSNQTNRKWILSQILDPTNVHCNRYAQRPRLFAAVLCAGLYPQIVQIQRPPKKFIDVMGNAIEKDVFLQELVFYVRTPRHPSFAALQDPNTNTSNTNTSNKSATTTPPSTTATHPAPPMACVVKRNDVQQGLFQRVFLHPSSVHYKSSSASSSTSSTNNGTSNSFSRSNYLVFGNQQRVVTGYDQAHQQEVSKVYVRETSEVSVLALALLGGSHLQITPLHGAELVGEEDEERLFAKKGEVLVTVDHWIRFRCSGRDARIVVLLQAGLQRVLRQLLTQDGSHSLQANEDDAMSVLTTTTMDSNGNAMVTSAVDPIVTATCALLDSAQVLRETQTSQLKVL